MSGAEVPRFPFTAVVGHDDAKLALLLNAVDPAVGGVLLRGQKGSAKSTLARALADLLPGDAPFVDLPLGATEDRVVGTLDLGAALGGGGVRVQPGLLAAAHGGVLYVDEVNLLPDHLVDVLLDVAAGGVNRIEREGVSHSHPSRFVLVGSMNPEEGDLRPQLLDRFGLAVEVAASTDPRERAEAVRRRLAFDRDPAAFVHARTAGTDRLREHLAAARPGALTDDLALAVSRLCAAIGAEGLRADLVVCRAAAALAGLEGRSAAAEADVRRVAPLALAHRRRRSPFEEPGIEDEEIERALEDKNQGSGAPAGGERVAEPGATRPVVPLAADRLSGPVAAGRRSLAEGDRGRLVGDRPAPRDRPPASVAVAATVRTAAGRVAADRSAGGPLALRAEDVRRAVRVQRAGHLIVLAVDASASMGVERRMEAVKATALGLLLDAYQRRDRVALVAFRGTEAEVVLRPTGSVEVARARLADLPTGGGTPLAAGIECALGLATTALTAEHRPLVVVVTDGRATVSARGDPLEAARTAAVAVRRRGVPAVVVDAEDGPTRLGLAGKVAEAMGARYLTLPELSAEAVRGVVERGH